MDNLIHKLDKLRGTSDLSSFDKQEIESLYKQVLAKTFVKTNCSDCYRDACIEMILQLKRYGKMKEKCNYSLKNGVLLQVAFGSGEFITNANITDENAEAYLRNNPQDANLFAELPEDWKERVNEKPVKEIQLDFELVALIQETLATGATVKSTREAYKGYELAGVKITNKVLDAHVKAAQDNLKSE